MNNDDTICTNTTRNDQNIDDRGNDTAPTRRYRHIIYSAKLPRIH